MEPGLVWLLGAVIARAWPAPRHLLLTPPHPVLCLLPPQPCWVAQHKGRVSRNKV